MELVNLGNSIRKGKKKLKEPIVSRKMYGYTVRCLADVPEFSFSYGEERWCLYYSSNYSAHVDEISKSLGYNT